MLKVFLLFLSCKNVDMGLNLPLALFKGSLK